MVPNTFARKLGIGVRVAGQILRDRANAAASASPGPQPLQHPGNTAGSSESPPPTRTANRPSPPQSKPVSTKTRAASEKTRNLGRASKRFGEAIWGPFARVSAVLWLEVTGLFFGLFALFFAQNVYRLRSAFATGREQGKFIIYAALTAIFVYFTFTSFYRARRKAKRTGTA